MRIDGATGEGGGQVLRSALSLSLLTRTPIEIFNIRARRSKPGLRPQHLRAVEAAAEVGQARLEGNRIGSAELHFRPTQVASGRYRFDIGTAGATSLVLQTVYLPLALLAAPSSVRVTGGTHVPLSPCFHYLDLSWRWHLARAGVALALTLERAGFYPPGGGIIHAAIEPGARVRPLWLEQRGALLGVRGISAGARLPAHVAERQREQARARLSERDVRADIEVERLDARSPGSMLLLLAEFEHARACYFALGERGKPAERVADEAADALLAFLQTDAVVDEYLADQLLLPLAFAEGDSILVAARITEHLRTNAEIIRLFLPVDFDIAGDRDTPGAVHIRPHRTLTA
ncbi:MAG: RNA 3'-phosphate cyclase [Gammaproteobacteria bacterium]|nr:RNA 3'-phosphate cyclase [Gammaproteobacteria bacterium]NIR84002.1 RNA 3'-phosphate cyclase [Gammaproteobacteria bacterium]NIR89146.1 RNA 3'-phosphate cyclase [Gammaproteobacteria bacterium]NIU04948.1 RNA 3'-phosphate cyclase [Gammaproteobacteria bacterium]NIV52114.1 RNA 3'-phosphate cyclase [Gammaproteobacteria bacterium]